MFNLFHSSNFSIVFFFTYLFIANNGLEAATHSINTRKLDANCEYILFFESSDYNSYVAIKEKMVYFDRKLISQKKWSYLSGPKLKKTLPVRTRLNQFHIRPLFDAIRGFTVFKMSTNVQSESGQNLSDTPKNQSYNSYYLKKNENYILPEYFLKFKTATNFFEILMGFFGDNDILIWRTDDNISKLQLQITDEIKLEVRKNVVWVADMPFNPPIVHTGSIKGEHEYLISIPKPNSSPSVYSSNSECKNNFILAEWKSNERIH